MIDIPGDYIAGFVDGEGCFCITMSKHKTKRLGVDPRLLFEIELRADDREILELIKLKIGCGKIYNLNYERYGWNPHVKYLVHSISDIGKWLIPFFQRYPLIAKKKKSFEIFCEAYKLFLRKEHLTEKGIEKLWRLRDKMNLFSSRQASARVRENRVPSGVKS